MSFPSVSQFSIAKGTGGTKPPEMYIPLWWYSGASSSINQTSAVLLGKGGFVGIPQANPSVACKLHTLNANWSPNIKYALEITLYSGSSNTTATAMLYDITSVSSVTASQITSSTTNFTVLRSAQFTLTPGHVYGVYFVGSTTTQVSLTDASLIVFPS